MEDFDAFARLVTALRPWLGQLAVVGGWAHRLQRFHRLANPPGHLPLRTRDTRPRLLDGRGSGWRSPHGVEGRWIHRRAVWRRRASCDALSLGGGGRCLLRGVPDAPPRQWGEAQRSARRNGFESRSYGPEDAVPGPAAGFAVERAGRTEAGRACRGRRGSARAEPDELHGPEVAHHSDRPAGKKAQDVLYIHDTLELFGASLGELHRCGWNRFAQRWPRRRPGERRRSLRACSPRSPTRFARRRGFHRTDSSRLRTSNGHAHTAWERFSGRPRLTDGSVNRCASPSQLSFCLEGVSCGKRARSRNRRV